MVDPEFLGELEHGCTAPTPAGPSIITEVPRFAEHAGGARVILKREDLNHTGSHKINNVLAQALLTKRMGKTRVIAETGAGQHGVATATAAALMGLECRIYMGKVDTERQALNVARMRMLGAEVVPVTTAAPPSRTPSTRRCATGSPTSHNTHYLLGTVTGPHPFPEMVRDFHRIIGVEARGAGARPRRAPPRRRHRVRGRGVQRDGHLPPVHRRRRRSGWSASRPGERASSRAGTRHGSRPAAPGVLHGTFSYLMQDDDGQTIESHSISAGLDYPSVGPEHAFLRDTGRAEYRYATDEQAMEAFELLCQHRGHHPRHRVGPRPRRRHGGGH